MQKRPVFSIADLDAVAAALKQHVTGDLSRRVLEVLRGPDERRPSEGEPQLVLSTHKERAERFLARTFPLRDVAISALAPPQAESIAGPVWEEVGPGNLGGRLTSLAVDPRDPDIVYAGSAGGGVWRTLNAGDNWTRVWSDQSATQSIGSLAIDPQDPDTIYCGTGEANLSADNYSGVGLFRASAKELDPDSRWELVAGCDDIIKRTRLGGFRFRLGLPRRIGCIAVDPFHSRHILLGGVTHTENESAALFESLDRGKTWRTAGDENAEPFFTGSFADESRKPFISPLNYFCHAVAFHPKKRGLVFVTVEARGSLSGIWISRDGGKSWTQARTPDVTGDQFGRTSLAVSPGSGTIYALASRQGTRSFLGFFRSDDFGDTWARMDAPGLRDDGQLSYTNCIAVNPDNPRMVIAGSLNLHKTEDGGLTWHPKPISDFEQLTTNPRYVHEDQHAIVIVSQRVYSANDGGFAVSRDLGGTWKTCTNGMAAGLIYGVQVAPSNQDCLSAGLQDQGLWFQGPLTTFARSARNPLLTDFRLVFRGDGGYTCYDPEDETTVFAASVHMELKRHRDQTEWEEIDTGIPERERSQIWQAVVVMERGDGPRKKPRAIYMGSRRLWRSINGGDTWRPESPSFDDSTITALDAPAENMVYVGTEKGGFYRSRDGCRTWSRNLAGPLSPGRMITGITTAADDPEFVMYTIGGLNAVVDADARRRPADFPPRAVLRHFGGNERVDGVLQQVAFSHVYFSDNGGDRWFSDTDNLPNLPHNAVASMKATGARFVAHDRGIHAGGGLPGWIDVSGNLPKLRITGLALHARSGWLYAATYGRGIWRIRAQDLEEFSIAVRSGSAATSSPLQIQRAESSSER